MNNYPRIAVVSNYYPDFLRSHYQKNKGLEHESYEVQLASLISSGFGDSDIYSNLFGGFGFCALNLIPNCSPLQSAWVRENTKYKSITLESIWVSQALEFGANIIYLHDINLVRDRSLGFLRLIGAKLICQIASPIPANLDLRPIDGFVTSFPHFAEFFKQIGKRVIYSPLAFDGRKAGWSNVPYEDRSHNLTFVGGIAKHHADFLPLLDRLCSKYPVSVFGYTDETIHNFEHVKACYRGPLWGNDMFKVLADTKIALNRHSSASNGFANNLRIFESMGMGALLLTDRKANNQMFFSPDTEAIEYLPDTIEMKIDQALQEKNLARKIAEGGRIRCLSEHQFVHRGFSLTQFIQSFL